MHVILVHNPAAGDSGHSRDAVAGLIRKAGHTVEAYSSKDDRWCDAVAGRADLVAAAGGDGTVAAVARALAGRDVPMAVLPFGTANNIACALRQEDRAIAELIAGWGDAPRQPFDIGVAKGAWGRFSFLESVGAGLLADAMLEIDHGSAAHVNEIEHPRTRIAAALDTFGTMLRHIRPVPCEITIDGSDRSGEYVVVEALNFGAAGPNLRLAPQAVPSDGLLDLVLVDDETRRGLVEHFALYSAEPWRAPRLPVTKGRRITMRCDGVALHLDDELRGPGVDHGTIELSVVAGALTFVVPASTPEPACG
jgi:diacylglycerol kinase (ATP)